MTKAIEREIQAISVALRAVFNQVGGQHPCWKRLLEQAAKALTSFQLPTPVSPGAADGLVWTAVSLF